MKWPSLRRNQQQSRRNGGTTRSDNGGAAAVERGGSDGSSDGGGGERQRLLHGRDVPMDVILRSSGDGGGFNAEDTTPLGTRTLDLKSIDSRKKALSRWQYRCCCLSLLVPLVILTTRPGFLGTFNFNPAPGQHKEQLPTLLHLVNADGQDLIYVHDHALYDQVASWRVRQDYVQKHTEPLGVTLSVSKDVVRAGDHVMLTWNSPDAAPLRESDVVTLVCGTTTSENDQDGATTTAWRLYEAATLAQVQATESYRVGVNVSNAYPQHGTWTLRWPRLPDVTMCQFDLYRVMGRGNTVDRLVASPMLHVTGVTTPMHLHLTWGDTPNEMIIMFVTASLGTPMCVLKNDVRYEGTSTTYQASDMCAAPANTTAPGQFMAPGQIHTVRLTELALNTTFTYRCGLEHGQGIDWSGWHSFVSHIGPMLPPHNVVSYVVYGDQATGDPARWTSRNMAALAHNVSQIHHVGDLSYAVGAAHVWDDWFAMNEVFSPNVPWTIAVGNHEYDHTVGGGGGKDPSGLNDTHGFMPPWGNFADDSHGECGVPTAARFAAPASVDSNGVFWYSFDYGGVHTTVISSEHDLSVNSRQHAWLRADLDRVNRTSTPWLVVESHRPLYEGENMWEQNAVGIGMRYEIEDVLLDYQVDLVLAGHYHAYHRSCDGLYQSRCDSGGPMHITVGSAGAWLDDAELYDNSWSSKFIPQTYGYGLIQVYNATHLRWQFVKTAADDDDTNGNVLDKVWVVRDAHRSRWHARDGGHRR